MTPLSSWPRDNVKTLVFTSFNFWSNFSGKYRVFTLLPTEVFTVVGNYHGKYSSTLFSDTIRYTSAVFVIFAAFKKSLTLNLAQRSFKVIHFGGNRNPVYDFIWAVNGKFRSIFNRSILPVLYAQSQLRSRLSK